MKDEIFLLILIDFCSKQLWRSISVCCECTVFFAKVRKKSHKFFLFTTDVPVCSDTQSRKVSLNQWCDSTGTGKTKINNETQLEHVATLRHLFGSELCCSSLSVTSLLLNDDSTGASNSSPKSLSAANWFSGELSFKMIFTASVKEYWREACSAEEVLGWATMAIIVQLASLAFEKRGKMARPVHGQRQRQGSRLKGDLHLT